MSGRKSSEQYGREVAARHQGKVLVVGKYDGAFVPILHKCLVCKKVWEASPDYMLRQSPGCTICVDNSGRKTHGDYVEELRGKVGETIVPLEPYQNFSTKIIHKCDSCQNVWLATPATLLRYGKCINCHIDASCGKQLKSHEEYEEEVAMMNPDIKVVGRYSGARTKCEHKCLICGNFWAAAPTNILKGKGCPNCPESRGAVKIRDTLKALGINFETEKRFESCRDIKPLPFDFYIPSHNLCIEFDGRQHFVPNPLFGGTKAMKGQQDRDKIKDEFCKRKKISLVRINYTQINYIASIVAGLVS